MKTIEHYMDIAYLSADRSTCLRRHIGAVAVKQDRIMATGRNGQVSGAKHCQTCLRDELKIPSGTDVNTCMAIHAEQNLLVQAALHGINLTQSTIYVTNKPCFTCVKLMASIKPIAIIYANDYPDDLTQRFLEENNWITEGILLPETSKILTVLRPQESKNIPLTKIFRGQF